MFMGRDDEGWPAPKGNLGDPIVAKYLAYVKQYMVEFRKKVLESSGMDGGEGGTVARSTSRSRGSTK